MLIEGKLFTALTHALKNLADALKDATLERKSEFEWFKSHLKFATKEDLEKLEKLMALNANQLEAGLNKLTEQQGKIAKEQADRSDANLAAIEALKKQLAEGEVSAGVQEAFAALQAAAQSLDDAIPDAPET